MQFTVVFHTREGSHAAYSLVFMPCPVWLGGGIVHNLHPKNPRYQKGDLHVLIREEPAMNSLAQYRCQALIVVHEEGYGTEADLVGLTADLKELGFAVRERYFDFESRAKKIRTKTRPKGKT